MTEEAKSYMNAALLFGQFNPELALEYTRKAMAAVNTNAKES